MMPPHFITKGKTQQALKSWDTENAPFGSFISVSDSGWTKQVHVQITFHHSFLIVCFPSDTKCLGHFNASLFKQEHFSLKGISLLWFENVFLKNIGEERPQILIFDGHDSHHHVELIESAREKTRSFLWKCLLTAHIGCNLQTGVNIYMTIVFYYGHYFFQVTHT